MPVIQCFFNDKLLKELPLKNNSIITIGRQSNNDIHIDNMAVSSVHAKIYHSNGSFFVEDNGSTNGTFLNGKEVKKHELEKGDIITVCKHYINFIDNEPEEEVKENSSMGNIEPAETVIFDASKMKEILREHKADAAIQKGTSKAWLIVTDGKSVNENFPLDKDIVKIGKNIEADIKTNGWFAPKISAVVHHATNGFYITPQKGKVTVNGKPILSSSKLKNEDDIRIKNLMIKFFVSTTV
ncbi:MAG: FHA domain-containing protein [Methylococcales bacterium]|jgi:predicted component of type VI protein secretion system|nr:FHA domain-containing protein [Methylococcales bacterium]MBT7408944.1 FHA domain-containing protein [Methylococcales bacterium]